MKNGLLILLVSGAVISASVAVFYNLHMRGEIARQNAAKAAANEEIANANARVAADEKAAEEAKARAAVAAAEKAKAMADEQRDRLAAERQRAENLKDEQAVAADNADKAALEAQASADARAKAEAEAAKAKEERTKQELVTKAAEAQAKKAADLRAVEEAKALELKTSLAELEQMKNEYDLAYADVDRLRRELEELKKTMMPEKTVTDLLTTGEATNSVAVTTQPVSPENDPRLPLSSRRLLKAERQRADSAAQETAIARRRMVRELDALAAEAANDGRVIDAEFYLKIRNSLDSERQ